jgi:hypothetical protein
MGIGYRAILVLLSVVGLSTVLAAEGDTEFSISSDNSGSEQNHPTVAVGSGGRFLVAWEDLRSGNGDIYCRSFSDQGTPVEEEFIVCDDTNNAAQSEPDLASDWYGNGYLVWKDYRHNGYPFGPDVYFQKEDSLGLVGVNRNITVELPDSSRQSPAVGVSGWGRTMVVWADLRNRNWDIYGQVMDAGGNFVAGNRKINDDASTTPQHEPEVAVSSTGWSVIVWYDGRNGNDDIYLQKCDSTGLPIGQNIRVNNDAGTTRQKFPAVAIGGDGVITVVWTDWRAGIYPANPDIYGQRFDAFLNRLGTNFLINLDGSQAAQRDPKVAADRMGNIVVVWSDSTGGDWNVSGQVIDASGRFVGQNLTINQARAGRQLFPDVALDGRRMYLVWADNRNGDYDIYGRVITYNNPTLTAAPSRLEPFCERAGDDTSVAMVIKNAGYGELPFRLQTDRDWIVLSETNGITPDTIQVTIRPGSLGWGVHNGRITMTDLVHNDSTGFVPVSLTITGPIIACRPDTLYFRALAEVGPPVSQTMAIANAGTGGLNWKVAATVSWFHLTPETGSDNGVVTVDCDITSLSQGRYSGYIVVEDSMAVNSPESTLVILDLEYGKAYLTAQPESVFCHLAPGEAATDSIRIINRGGVASHWLESSAAPWLVCDSAGGGDGDILRFTIAAGTMNPGQYSDSIRVEDTAAFNNPFMIPVTLAIYQPDSIFLPPVITKPGDPFQLQVWLYEHRPANRGYLAFTFDPKLIAVDSVVPISGNFPSGQITAIRDTLSAAFTLEIITDSTNGLREAGRFQLADIYATAHDSLVDSTAFQTAGSETFYLIGHDELVYHPVLDAGLIEITNLTSIDDQGDGHRPATNLLNQNVPNPFNNATDISFSLGQAGSVQVDVYNILGQRVCRLMDDFLPAGNHHVSWDGCDQVGRAAASGVYFYALTTTGRTLVRKMAFLK